MGKLRWYKRDPNAALVGMRGMTLEECGAYNIVLDLIYTHDGRLADDERFLAGWIGSDLRVWRRLRQRLLDLKKIEVADGYITNPRASVEVQEGLARVEKASSAGKASARSRGTFGKSSHELSGKVANYVTDTYPPMSAAFVMKNNELTPTKDELAFQLSTTTTTPTKKDNSIKGANAPREMDARGEYYAYGEVVLGNKQGATLTSLLRACNGDIGQAHGVLVSAHVAASPQQYVWGVINNGAKNGNGNFTNGKRKSNGHDFFARMANAKDPSGSRNEPPPEPSRGPTIDLTATEVGGGPSGGFGGLLGLPNAK